MNPFDETMRRRVLGAGLASAAASMLPAGARAAAPDAAGAGTGYPNRPIEIVVPAAAGGGTDILARAFANAARNHLKAQSFVIENKGGASGAIGMGEVLNARPDGYRLGMLIVELAILPHMKRIRFTTDDFEPIARLNQDPAAITVRADSPWKMFADFRDAAKKAPGAVSMGNSGIGSIWHLAAAALGDRIGAKFTGVAFPGAAPAVVALLGGHLDAVAVSPGEVAEHVASGRMRTLAVMAGQRSPGVFDGVPTLKELGIDLEVGAWRGLAAPRHTPAAIIERLGHLARDVAADPAFRDALKRANLGLFYGDAAQFRQTMDHDNAFFRDLIARIDMTE